MHGPYNIFVICLLLVHSVLCFYFEHHFFGYYRPTEPRDEECETPCFFAMFQMSGAVDGPHVITREKCEHTVSNHAVQRGFCHRLVNKAVMDVNLVAKLVKYSKSGRDSLKIDAIKTFCSNFCRRK